MYVNVRIVGVGFVYCEIREEEGGVVYYESIKRNLHASHTLEGLPGSRGMRITVEDVQK